MKIKWDKRGLRELRYMPSTVRLLEAKGKPIAARANAALKDDHSGFVMSSDPIRRHHRVSVGAVSVYARRHNAKHNTLLRLLGD